MHTIDVNLQTGEQVLTPFTVEQEAEYQAKLSQPAPKVVPQKISIAQARLALLSAGMLDDVNGGVVAFGQAAQIEWEYRTTVHRNNALVIAMKELLNWTDEQMDDLFILASNL